MRATARGWTLALSTICVALAASLSAARADVLFENVTLIDGTGAAPLPGASVLVKGDRIDIVSAGPIRHGAGVQVVDGKGKFLMPGLIDSHVHIGANTTTQENWREKHEVGVRALQGYLYSGVTSVYDSGNVSDFTFGLREEERAGKFVSTRLFASGTTVAAPTGYGSGTRAITVDDWSKAQPVLDAYFKNRKPDVQKIVIARDNFAPDNLAKVVRLANENGIRTTIHASGEDDYNDALAAHVDEFAHALRTPVSEPMLKLLATRRIPMSTTLAVFSYIERVGDDTSFLDEPLWKASVDADIIANEKGPARQRYIESNMSANFKKSNSAGLAAAKQLHDAGGVIVAGTDRGWGPTLHMEVALLHSAGIPLLDITRIATLNGAIYVGQEKNLGSIQRGKLADLLLLNADPTKDVKNFMAIEAVYKGGQKIDRSKLDLPANRK